MNEKTAKAKASHLRILGAAGRSFRATGFGATGIDGLAKGANLTSGAFYFHFRSKLDVFIASLRHGLQDLTSAIRDFQRNKGETWLSAWVDYYLGFKRTCDLAEGCSFPVLTPEVERAGGEARKAYEEELNQLIASVAAGLPAQRQSSSREQAIVILAMLSGGVNMARAVKSRRLSAEIASVLKRAVLELPRGSKPRISERSLADPQGSSIS